MGYYVVDEGKYIFLNDREKENRGLNYNRANITNKSQEVKSIGTLTLFGMMDIDS